MEEIDWSEDILAVVFSLVYGIVSLMYNLNIGRCICRYTQSIVSGMNDSNTLNRFNAQFEDRLSSYTFKKRQGWLRLEFPRELK